MDRPRVLLLYALSDESATFSYHNAWPRKFQASPHFDCTAVNVAGRDALARVRRQLSIRTWSGDAIVILHSVFSNSPMLTGGLFDLVRELQPPKVYFIGNEYKFMPEKMEFAERLPVSLLVTQSSSPAVHALYRSRLGCHVAAIPNTGLDVELFRPLNDPLERPIDIGYRAADVPAYIGHNERRELADYFNANAARWGLRCDISLSRDDRLNEGEWAAFLNRCRGQIGSEAGGDYFTLDDDRRHAVNHFVATHPGVARDEIQRRFFEMPPAGIPLRILSGRHVEAAGTRTCQILFEGHYDGYFVADEHYIPLKRDFSNADEAIRKFQDRDYTTRIVDNAHRVATTQLTYERLIERFHAVLMTALNQVN